MVLDVPTGIKLSAHSTQKEKPLYTVLRGEFGRTGVTSCDERDVRLRSE